MSIVLDAEQAAAVAAPLDRHVLVCGNPGGGKTRVLTARYVHLLQQGVPPAQIMAVTFTNKAAREMKERIAAATGLPEKQLSAATFHSYCARWLCRFADRAGIQRNYSIVDDNDTMDILKRLVRASGSEEFPGFDDSPPRLRKAISCWKSSLVDPETALVLASMDPAAEAASLGIRSDPVLLARLYQAYQEALRAANSLDFDDLLVKMVYLLREDARVLFALGYSHVLVDEYQDVNQVQYSLLQALASGGARLYLVGDRNQSIYRFRRVLSTVTEMYVADYDPLVYYLTVNYRSAPAIVHAANALIQHNGSAYCRAMQASASRPGWLTHHRVSSPDEERTSVVSLVRTLLSQGYPPREIAVLSRVSHVLRDLEEAFYRHGLSCHLPGAFGLFDYHLVRVFLAHWRVLVNPNDRAALRLFLLHQPGVGEATAERTLAGLPADIPDFAALVRYLASPASPCARLLSPDSFDWSGDEPLALVRAVYTSFLNAKAAKDLASLRPAAARRVSGFLQHLADDIAFRLSAGEDLLDVVGSLRLLAEPRDSSDAVTLSTIHAAKGLEFDVVILVSAVEGVLPLTPDLSPLDEERRLCYVAATRARERLYIFYADGYLGRHRIRPSRFLSEMSLLEEVS